MISSAKLLFFPFAVFSTALSSVSSRELLSISLSSERTACLMNSVRFSKEEFSSLVSISFRSLFPNRRVISLFAMQTYIHLMYKSLSAGILEIKRQKTAFVYTIAFFARFLLLPWRENKIRFLNSFLSVLVGIFWQQLLLWVCSSAMRERAK